MAAPDNQAFALRQLVDELGAQLRAGVEKLGDLPQETGERLARELGLVTREEYDALALRLAQLEHRLKLLERPRTRFAQRYTRCVEPGARRRCTTGMRALAIVGICALVLCASATAKFRSRSPPATRHRPSVSRSPWSCGVSNSSTTTCV